MPEEGQVGKISGKFLRGKGCEVQLPLLEGFKALGTWGRAGLGRSGIGSDSIRNLSQGFKLRKKRE